MIQLSGTVWFQNFLLCLMVSTASLDKLVTVICVCYKFFDVIVLLVIST